MALALVATAVAMFGREKTSVAVVGALANCMLLPPAPAARIFKEMFEKIYFNWLLGVVP